MYGQKLQELIESLKNADLLNIVEQALTAVLPDIELATMAYDEMVRRNRKGVIREARGIFTRVGIKPIPWLAAATKCLEVLEISPPGPYQGHLYVVLIDGFTEQNQFYGAYVGSSR
jgi:hypothetical protein